jgi:hypothetical protein
MLAADRPSIPNIPELALRVFLREAAPKKLAVLAGIPGNPK